MNRIFLIILLLFSYTFSFCQQLKPVSETEGKLNITVDPRMELLSAVQVISEYPTINRKPSYSNDLKQYFGKYSNHEAAKMTASLAREYGFVYDAPVNLMLCLSQAPELKAVHPFSDRLIERAGGKENLEKYSAALNEFAIYSHFYEFWEGNKPYYQKMVEYTAADLAGFNPVGKLEAYYNETKNSYTVTLSPSFAGGYGIRIPVSNGGTDIYGCLNVSEIKDGILYFSQRGLSYFLWHEFSHSYVNPLTDTFNEKINKSSGLYEPLESEMKLMACHNWENCVNEHIIRAVFIRLLTLYGNKNEAEVQLEKEKSLRFAYVKPIIEKLKQFEQQRDKNNITFTEYYPTLITVFDSLARSDNENLVNPPFTGPIRSVLSSHKIAIIYPTNDTDSATQNGVIRYVSNIQKAKGNTSILCSDTAALKMNLSDYNIMAYGTIESNLFLNRHMDTFPFKIKGDTIFTDKKFVGKGLRIITCLPNPQNNKKGMMVNTSVSNRNLKGVNNIFADDYIVFEDIENILQQGSYQKEDTWHF
jgi:hypothetical protein